MLNDRFAALDWTFWTTALGRGRVFVNSISLPQTCLSNWHAIRPTKGRATSCKAGLSVRPRPSFRDTSKPRS